MTKLIVLSAIVFSSVCYGQKKDTLPTINIEDWSEYTTCLADHGTKDGHFTCDFNGHYFPWHIYDSTITRWFVRVQKNGDSLFYYRHPDRENVYLWDKNGNYVDNIENPSLWIGMPYEGDTLRTKEQVWNSQKPIK